jgi:hypothetical protein
MYRQIVPIARYLQAEVNKALSPAQVDALDHILTKLHASSASLLPETTNRRST